MTPRSEKQMTTGRLPGAEAWLHHSQDQGAES